jgi:hypothetical protein
VDYLLIWINFTQNQKHHENFFENHLLAAWNSGPSSGHCVPFTKDL